MESQSEIKYHGDQNRQYPFRPLILLCLLYVAIRVLRAVADRYIQSGLAESSVEVEGLLKPVLFALLVKAAEWGTVAGLILVVLVSLWRRGASGASPKNRK